MVYDSVRRRVVAFGGVGGTGDTWEWDGEHWSQRLPLTSPTQRYRHAMAFDATRNRSVLFGGYASGLSNETWEMMALSVPASFDLRGPGCMGSGGVPALDATTLPWIGAPFVLELLNADRQLVVLLGLGAAEPNLHLDWFGMPTCYLNTSSDVFVGMNKVGPRYVTTIAIPADVGLNGAVIYFQSVVLDPGANARGLVLSNSRRAVLEIR